ncbi:hypothetical protein RM780_01730 [Streptomyces sp. DSM 44917]|uniref:Uncharacterized protein n=1 Tax=Streptomyces boetiae TaxID=3075541 RepID=A0ABU2L2A3_9ACTN|nr:hypothetical protein [Streptomyces sp. DSM 44917]MDT0305684.1 hypothetical protein [Streptomyces sp. DSM 44917]
MSGGLSAVEWRDDERPERAVPLEPAFAGVHLGTARDGRPVALPGPGPAGSRIAVLGDPLFARLVALRLLAVGARVTAATRAPGPWRALQTAAGERLTVAEEAEAQPVPPPAPPAVDDGPQALVSELRRPPSAASAAGAWRTAVHVAPAAPRRSAFWTAPDALLALDARFAEGAGAALGEEAARATAALAPGDILLFRPGAGPMVLRPDIAPGETALLTPADAAPPPRAGHP